MAYTKGQEIRFSAAFKNAAGAPANPTSVTFELKAPGSAVASCTPVPDDVGNYHYDAILSPGMWHWRWEGTGALNVADEGTVQVEKSQFT